MMSGNAALARYSRQDGADNAWSLKYDSRPTNYKMQKGDTVLLLAPTRTEVTKMPVPAGVNGVVQSARTARPYRRPGVSSCYVADVSIKLENRDVRIRVPHGALRIVSAKE
jgi:hypothetical protein